MVIITKIPLIIVMITTLIMFVMKAGRILPVKTIIIIKVIIIIRKVTKTLPIITPNSFITTMHQLIINFLCQSY